MHDWWPATPIAWKAVCERRASGVATNTTMAPGTGD